MRQQVRNLYRGKFLELVARGHWEFVQRVGDPACVGIVALTADRKVVLISQFRIPVNKTVVEIPAGLVGDHGVEPWQTAALRELREETGYAGTDMQFLTAGPTSAGLSSECIQLVRARNVTKVGEPEPDGDEQIQVHAVPLAEVDTFLCTRESAGDLIDPKVYAALYFLRHD